jgi:hypothetical protein
LTARSRAVNVLEMRNGGGIAGQEPAGVRMGVPCVEADERHAPADAGQRLSEHGELCLARSAPRGPLGHHDGVAARRRSSAALEAPGAGVQRGQRRGSTRERAALLGQGRRHGGGVGRRGARARLDQTDDENRDDRDGDDGNDDASHPSRVGGCMCPSRSVAGAASDEVSE